MRHLVLVNFRSQYFHIPTLHLQTIALSWREAVSEYHNIYAAQIPVMFYNIRDDQTPSAFYAVFEEKQWI